MDISIAESDNNDDIYISDKENIIEDKLITYLEEKYKGWYNSKQFSIIAEAL